MAAEIKLKEIRLADTSSKGLGLQKVLNNDYWISMALGFVRWMGTSLTLWVSPPGTCTGFVSDRSPFIRDLMLGNEESG